MARETKGRMLNRDIANSNKFARLSPEAAVLFCMIIPHLSGHGKLNGGAGYLKDEVCPKIPYLTLDNIPRFMLEITTHTSMKWFKHDGRYWIHSTKHLSKHQNLNLEKLGTDKLPNYSGVTPELVVPEVEVEVKVEVEKTLSSSGDEACELFYETKRKRKLSGKRLETFLLFWEAFNYKAGKAPAADSWMDIPELTGKLVDQIILAAKAEAARRPGTIQAGKTPKMAQGWLTEKRWEDEALTAEDAYTPAISRLL
jgi:hypothetical protein